MPYLVSFGANFEKTIVIFEINTLKFVLLQSFVQKLKYLNLGHKCLMRMFGLGFEKGIVIREINTLNFF